MKRMAKLLGFGLLLTAVLAVAIGGTALAATRSGDRVRDQLKDGPCTTCDPIEHDYGYNYDWTAFR
jgi:hypothetical protein